MKMSGSLSPVVDSSGFSVRLPRLRGGLFRPAATTVDHDGPWHLCLKEQYR